MDTNNHDVSVIIVNWNGQRFVNDCLESCSRQSYLKNECIFVDNNSTDQSIAQVASKFPSVKVISLINNKGYAGGNCEGLRSTTTEFVALLNNDARAEPDWLEQLLMPMIEDASIGICASKIVFTESGLLNSAGDGLTVAGVGFNLGLNHAASDFVHSEFVFGACGAAVLYRRKMLDEIGFLDEDFFLYDEDTDLNFRAQLAGWKCAYVPTAVVQHIGNATAGRLSDIHVYYHSRNLEFVWIKNMPMALMIRYAHQKLIQEIGSFAYLCLRHGKWRPFFRAKRDALRMLPVMWKKRREIQKRRRVTTQYIRDQLTSMFNVAMLRQKLQQFLQG